MILLLMIFAGTVITGTKIVSHLGIICYTAYKKNFVYLCSIDILVGLMYVLAVFLSSLY